MKILFSDWMRELDSEAIEHIGIPSIILMENAASGTADYISNEFPLEIYNRIAILAGPGNNGGDGIAVGRKLFRQGYEILIIFLTNPEKYSGDPLINFNIIKKIGIPFEYISDMGTFKEMISGFSKKDSVVVDAIFGTGINSPVKNSFFSEVIDNINDSGLKIASIDIPSGLSDKFDHSGSSKIFADITATFQALKIPHLFPDFEEYSGRIRIIDIGIPTFLLDKEEYYIELIKKDVINQIFHSSHPGNHKGNFGHAFVIAGSKEKPGAASMASFAALRSGSGLVTCATISGNIASITGAHPEIMTLPDLSPEELISSASGFDTVLAGPGMGLGENTEQIVKGLIKQYRNPLVLDADALNILEGEPSVLKEKRGEPVIITPHPKEFSRLSGIDIKDIKRAPIKFARDFSLDFNLFVVLKGHRTVISSPDGKVFVNETGNPGMATGGSGDVLSGIILGLISRVRNDFKIENILNASVFIHGFAGDIAEEEKGEIGMTASDIISYLPYAIKRINEFKSEFSII